MRYLKFHGTREQQIKRLRGQGWKFATMKNAPVVIGWHAEHGKIAMKAWGFKADKPAWYYIFPNEAAARDYSTKYAAGVQRNAEYRAKRDADRKAARCNGVEAIYAKAAKEGRVSCTEAAVCLRVVLAREFPSVKFSVRSDRCIRVSWTDGPSSTEVEAIARNYAGQGFDGMIDLRYNISRWLSRDGSMSLAHDTGTVGSAGVHSEAIGSAHAPDAVLVSVGSDFVFCEREISEPVKRDLCARLCAYYGLEMPDLSEEHALDRFLNTTQVHGDYLCSLLYQVTSGALKLPETNSVLMPG